MDEELLKKVLGCLNTKQLCVVRDRVTASIMRGYDYKLERAEQIINDILYRRTTWGQK